jgi:hypothetical protein
MAPTMTRCPTAYSASRAAAELFDDADGLVAQNQARPDRIFTPDDVDVRPANRRRRDANHRLSPARQRPRHFLEGDAVLLFEYDGLSWSSCRTPCSFDLRTEKSKKQSRRVVPPFEAGCRISGGTVVHRGCASADARGIRSM